MTSKATKYLDGLLKIPFGIYKEEVIISFLDKFKIKIETALKSDNNNTIVNTESDINNIFNDLQNNNLSLFEKNSNLYNEWQEYNIKKIDYIKFVRNTLDNCVYGHDNIKLQFERIIGQWINGKSNGAVIGLVGPPGIGKTCIIKNGLSKCLVDADNNLNHCIYL